MKLRRIVASAAATVLATGVGVAVAGQASADHNATVALDGSSCYIGPWTSPVPLGLRTTERIRLSYAADGSATYVCRFDVPEFIPASQSATEEDWRLPRRAVVYRDVYCWRPGEEESGETGPGPKRFVLRPNGSATLTCHTDGQYYGDPPVESQRNGRVRPAPGRAPAGSLSVTPR